MSSGLQFELRSLSRGVGALLERLAAGGSRTLALIVGVALLVRVLVFSGYFGSDDSGYAVLAHQLISGQLEIPLREGVEVHSLRIGVFWPVALLFATLGVSEFAMLIYPFVTSLLTVALAYLAARWMIGPRAGVVAGLLAALLPLDARSATVLMPDGPAALMAAGGVLAARRAGQSTSPRSQALWGGAAGAGFLGAWLTKESIVYLAPFVLGYLLWLAIRRKRAAVLAGCAAVCLVGVLVESAAYWRLTESPLYRLEAVERSYESTGAVWRQASDWGQLFVDGADSVSSATYWKEVAKRVVVDGPRQLLLTHTFGLIPALALVAVFYAWYHRLREWQFVAWWFASVLLMFNFSSASFTTYRPLPLADRFVYLELFPAILLAAALVDRLLPRASSDLDEVGAERGFWGAACLVCLLSMCAVGLGRYVLEGPASRFERRAASVLSPEVRLVSDERTVRSLRFFWGFPELDRSVEFEDVDPARLERGDLVLLNESRLSFLRDLYDYQLPAYMEGVLARSRPSSELDGLYEIETSSD